MKTINIDARKMLANALARPSLPKINDHWPAETVMLEKPIVTELGNGCFQIEYVVSVKEQK